MVVQGLFTLLYQHGKGGMTRSLSGGGGTSSVDDVKRIGRTDRERSILFTIMLSLSFTFTGTRSR